MVPEDRIIRSMRLYQSTRHHGLRGWLVVVRVVWRGEVGLEGDSDVGELRPDDVVEVAPLLQRGDGTLYASWVTSDAAPSELGTPAGVFDGPAPAALLCAPGSRG